MLPAPARAGTRSGIYSPRGGAPCDGAGSGAARVNRAERKRPSVAEPHFQIAQHFLPEPGQRAGFVLLGSFLASFLFIRTGTRLIRKQVRWWPGNVTTKGGLHIHHLVWGILFILISGFLEFALAPSSPWLEVLAAVFGLGAGLTLDEFALWVHLEDVYWAEEGRASLDAIVVAALFGGLLVVGLARSNWPRRPR
jgi:hypothetical protein